MTAPTSELCCELGAYFEECGDLAEAAMWYQNALSETESILDARTGNEIPTRALERFDKIKEIVRSYPILSSKEQRRHH